MMKQMRGGKGPALPPGMSLPGGMAMPAGMPAGMPMAVKKGQQPPKKKSKSGNPAKRAAEEA